MRPENKRSRARLIGLPRRLVVCTIALATPTACVPASVTNDAPSADAVDDGPLDTTEVAVDVVAPDAIAVTADVFDLKACDGSPFQPGYACLPDPNGDPHAECTYDRYCSDRECPTGCVACAATEYIVGVTCIRDVHADAGVTCPTTRMCQPTECPTGCVGCVEPLQCVADLPNPDGSPRRCSPDTVCDSADCPAGCHVVA